MTMIGGYEAPWRLLQLEFEEQEFSGRRIEPALKEAFAMLHPERDAWNGEALRPIAERLAAAPQRSDWSFVEPDELDAIRRERMPTAPPLPAPEGLEDRMRGAWTGRAVGCALGQPVEGWRRSEIKRFLQGQGDWELDDFFRAGQVDYMTVSPHHQSCRDSIAFMGPDDDIRYTLIGLLALERFGRNFVWHDVADLWNEVLPFNMVCTAEAQALLNYNLRKMRCNPAPGAATAAFTRRHNNPYRQWIGAQIRADGWAYCAAGDPELAAEFAWRDACWTHAANGIYGEMFVAAVIAAAFAETDPVRLIEIGLGQIPRRSQLAAAVIQALDWFDVCPSWEEFMDRLDERYARMNWVHTINNLLVCLMGIYYGEMRPERSIAIAVMGGMDTDCNGATVGSIVGAAAGRGGFGKMAARINDTIRPAFAGIDAVSTAELAARCLAVREKL